MRIFNRTTVPSFLLFLSLSIALGTELRIDVPLNPSAAMELDFASDVWSKASKIEGLHRMGSRLSVMGMEMNEEAKHKTDVYITRDSKGIYVGFDCVDIEIHELNPGEVMSPNGWPEGDKIEIYLDGDRRVSGDYYQFVANPAGRKIEVSQRRIVDPGDWKVVSRIQDDRWQVVVYISYDYLGISEKSSGLNGMFYRDYHPHRRGLGVGERSTWGGGPLHEISAFGEIIFSGGTN